MKALAMIYASMIENFQKNRTLRNLSKLNDSQLDDIGVSRELLAQGTRAYPWLILETGLQQPTTGAVLFQFKQKAANDNDQLPRAA
ncbi:DUF1127 domain-containing protein [uncultured Thiothrix sp.]|uniref:DUF1127 domain-containing protein n=1 Tax=uncultured Thiothrix sp. TaxID=223185 RepID=UPI00260AFB9D|nr:DUF1127 domain-containing protein [uncultured Thiothrix sp.]HMT92714.1 DUF1127 domain-containing protein [Thiolinea sp.]